MGKFVGVVNMLILALAACGGDDSASIDAAGGSCTVPCNTLALPTVVSKTADAASRPAFTGGAIVDGTYKVTSVVTYGTATPGGTTLQEVYRFAGNTVESGVASSEMAEMHFCGTFTTAANMITFNLTCPTTGSITLEYTMAGSTYSFQHGSNQNEVAFATP
jgi:hypothetical protein